MAKDSRKPFDPWLIPPEPPPATSPQAIADAPQTVSQITTAIKHAITRALPATVHVIGQISNLKRHTSGHLYLTLKDHQCELPCVMRQSDVARLKFKTCDGLEVVASGSIEVFDRAGRYQLYIRRLEPRGVGSLELAFRQLYEKLEKEGLFDPHRKKRIPRFPRRMAVVTSPTGAAIADILRTVHHRFPCIPIVLFPARVQGAGASAEIAEAIRLANARALELGGIDVMIVGRGGGSLEDLWAFNEEAVARAVFASAIPIISGVGHEVDTTICDLVADARAATPTAAAQMAVPVRADVLQDLAFRQARMRRGVAVRWDAARHSSASLEKRSAFRDPLTTVRHRLQTVDLLGHRLHRRTTNALATLIARLDRLERVVQRIAPGAVVGALALRLSRLDRAVNEAWQKRLGSGRRNLEIVTRCLDQRSPNAALLRGRDRIGHLHHRMAAGQGRVLETVGNRLQAVTGLLQAVGHQRVLERGYSLTRTADGALVRSVAQLTPGVEIVTVLRDGRAHSTVQKTDEGSPATRGLPESSPPIP